MTLAEGQPEMAQQVLLSSLARTVSKSSMGPIFLRASDDQLNTPERLGYHFRIDHTGIETTLVVVFDGETQRRFFSLRIMLYCNMSWMEAQHTWVIRQLEHATHSSRDHVHHAPPNDPAFPQLTIAFEVVPRNDSSVYCDFIPTSSVDELCCRDSKSVCILLDSKHSITPDILSVAMAVTRIVRAHPEPEGSSRSRRRITISYLPTELLLKIFEDTHSCSCQWQNDLLSFAQVCRQWSQCAMKLLFARLESSKWKEHCLDHSDQTLDPWAFAKALSETPALGLGVQHLDIDQHNGLLRCWLHNPQKRYPVFLQSLIAILRATKNLQRLHLALGSQANTRFLSLPKLPYLHTLSIKRAFYGYWSLVHTQHSINTFQLACCMARWPGLTSLTVEDLRPGNIGMGRFFLRPPACALTQLCIRNSAISDKDLLHLTASSAKTLTQVTLDHMWGITDGGLGAFLDSISQNVTSLTIWNVRSLEFPPNTKDDWVLDHVVDKMRCLQELNIRGDVASEHMIRRRSEMFVRSCGLGVPVVRLSSRFVAGIAKCAGHEWAGWEVVDLR